MPASQLLSLTTALQIIGKTCADSPVYLRTVGWNSSVRWTSTEVQTAHIHTLLKQYSTQDLSLEGQTCLHVRLESCCKKSAPHRVWRLQSAWIHTSYHEFTWWPAFMEKSRKPLLPHNLLLSLSIRVISKFQTVIVKAGFWLNTLHFTLNPIEFANRCTLVWALLYTIPPILSYFTDWLSGPTLQKLLPV